MFIFFITILGLAFRLINIDKPEGLWNDEYVSWFVASIPFGEGFWQEILKQCHMPLYYLYLKPFTGFSDIVLRLTSVLPSILAIPVMYLIGKEYSKNIAKISALVTAVLPFLVYYAQEVRFYSLLFLFSAICLLYTIKLAKGEKKLCGYLVSAGLVLSTHVLGIIYVFFTACYIFIKKRAINKKIVIGLLLGLIIIIPLGINILKMLSYSQWWGNFSYTNILFLFSDFLSPILTNNINAPRTFFYNQNFIFNLFLTIPTLLAVLGISFGIKKEKGLALLALGVILIMAILSFNGIIVFITKYSMEILPILILLFAIGASDKKYIWITYVTILILSALFIFYPSYQKRSEGHKLVCDIINKQNPDKIIYTYYDENRFKKYLNQNYKSLDISKTYRFQYVNSVSKIFDNVNSGEKISIVFLDSVSFLPENYIEKAKENNVPEMFITFSIIRNSLTNEIKKRGTDINIEHNGSWTVITAIYK